MEDDPRRHRCCRRCREEWEADNADLGTVALAARHMSVCPQCGSKRCPRADDHRAVCQPPLTRDAREVEDLTKQLEAAERANLRLRERVRALELEAKYGHKASR